MSVPGRPFLHAPPHTPSSQSLVLSNTTFPFPPGPLVSVFSLPQPLSQWSLEVSHLKLVQRKPGKTGVAAPTGIGQQAYSLGTGSSGSHWSPHGARPGGGRMEELEELEEGRQVKNSHPTDQQTLPQTHTHTLLSLFAPPPTFTLSHLRQGPA